MNSIEPQSGQVVLVGAGPGDPGLICESGTDWLARADVVVYDRLANPALLDACRPDAKRVYVGKRPDAHTLPQEQINALLVEKCREGNLVVRLKGGDPLIFGRGGEEIAALADAGCRFRLVPGITAAIAAGAYAGIPLTERHKASTVAFVTGHENPAKDASALDFPTLAKIDTLVFYMSVGNLEEITRSLIRAGRGGRTPAAIVANATRPNQRTVAATLGEIAAVARREDIRPPAVLIVGVVAAAPGRFAWYEKLPLFGRTVLVTRTRLQASELSARLAALGAEVIEAPTIEIAPPESFDAVDEALRRVGAFDWVVLTSPNSVEAIFERIEALELDARCLGGVRIAAVGVATAAALGARSIRADLVPASYTTEALGEGLISAGMEHKRVLLARADIATDALPQALADAGADVEQVAVYRTVRPDRLDARAVEALRERRVDWITFTSSSTVGNFAALALPAGVGAGDAKLAAIGPVTAETLTAHNLAADVVADPHTIDGLVAALLNAETSETS